MTEQTATQEYNDPMMDAIKALPPEGDDASSEDKGVSKTEANGSTQDDKAGETVDTSSEDSEQETIDISNMSFEDQVKLAVENATKQGDKIVFLEGTPENVEYAARLSIRHRDSQSALESEKRNTAALKDKLADTKKVEIQVSEEEQKELDHLYSTDREAYTQKMFELRDKATKDFEENNEKESQKAILQKREVEAYNNYIKYQAKYADMDISPDKINDWINKNIAPIDRERWLNNELNDEQFFDICRQRHTGKITLAKPKKPAKMINIGKGSSSPDTVRGAQNSNHGFGEGESFL